MATDWRKDLEKLPDFGPEFTLAPARTALVLIDMQYLDAHPDYGLGKVLRERYPEAAGYFCDRLAKTVIPNQRRLLAAFRDARLRIVHLTVGAHLPDNSDFVPLRREADERVERETGKKPVCYPMGTFEHGILPEVAPRPGELVLNKVSRSAFTSTGLDQILRNMGVDHLLVTGVMTNSCVEMTARDAADRGYKTVIVDDASATFTQDMHDAVLRTFRMLYGKVQTTDEVLAEIAAGLGGARRAAGAA
ncbi:MAG TPA: isochorismatase family cysteine hydrolase [Candidatus Binatia bacterium]|jgi:nicotinamidase-related amidase|nr:isochorismatase family cysteine hydrolase [Candidatus Binatia bacterium]